jgi:hypothetical protein
MFDIVSINLCFFKFKFGGGAAAWQSPPWVHPCVTRWFHTHVWRCDSQSVTRWSHTHVCVVAVQKISEIPYCSSSKRFTTDLCNFVIEQWFIVIVVGRVTVEDITKEC